MENGVAILWKNYLQLFSKSTCKKHSMSFPPKMPYLLTSSSATSCTPNIDVLYSSYTSIIYFKQGFSGLYTIWSSTITANGSFPMKLQNREQHVLVLFDVYNECLPYQIYSLLPLVVQTFLTFVVQVIILLIYQNSFLLMNCFCQ